MTRAPAPKKERLLDLSSGWPLLVSALLCLVVVVGWAGRLQDREPAIGDGRSVDTYGFDLSTTLVPREEIIAAGIPRDGLPAMVDPEVFTPAEAQAYGKQLRRSHEGKYLVDSDRVIGVAIGGEARAYPLKILNWHEIANDTLGGVPIAVTYNPLCDSAVVFDRTAGGEVLTFGVSGLIYNSNLLMYDRRPGGEGESLWSQLAFKAVAGPAARRGATLTIVPFLLATWGQWNTLHPDTTVLAPDRERYRIYGRTYEPYLGSPQVRFDVRPPPPSDGPAPKDRVIAIRRQDGWHAWPARDLDEEWYLARVLPEPADDVDRAATAASKAEPALNVPAFWFAWHAFHPDTQLHAD